MTFNLEIKGTLAKLLASENLIVEHKNVETAYFNVDTRQLVLPMWKKASSVVYDMLVGHEVGHALYTPNEDWSAIFDIPKDYVNIVEDVRIEKLMKRKFPGLSRSFYWGYKELNDADFFGTNNKNPKTFSFIDRINLFYKVGNYISIPFQEDEKYFIDKINAVETFQQVLEICRELYKFVNDKKKNQEVVSDTNDTNLVEQQSENTSSTSNQNVVESESEEDVVESEKKEETKDSGETNNTGGESGNEEISETQSNFDDKLSDLSDNSEMNHTYVQIPDLDINKIIVSSDVIEKYCSNHWKQISVPGHLNEFDSLYKKYKEESRKEVNYLVKEFECKKTADAYARSTVSRTGVLDTTKLHTYKYNEDLFKKVSIVPNGKNHGLIFILDWSSSMAEYILDTVKQLLNLVWFCKKVQIPFEVYAFTNEWNDRYLGDVDEDYKLEPVYDKKHGTISVHERFKLMNLISSTAKSKSFEFQCLNLWRLAVKQDRHYYTYYDIPYGLEMSGTPLDESIMCLHKIIPMFKNRENLQKVNVIILTDGEAAGLQFDVEMSKYGKQYSDNTFGKNRVGPNCILRDKKTGHTYKSFDYYEWERNATNILLKNLKDNYPYVNIIGFRILSAMEFFRFCRYIGSSKDQQESISKVWKKEKSYEFNPDIGYDRMYTISSTNLDSSSKTFEVSDDATNAQITRAFKTMLKKKTVNKKLLSSFTTMIA